MNSILCNLFPYRSRFWSIIILYNNVSRLDNDWNKSRCSHRIKKKSDSSDVLKCCTSLSNHFLCKKKDETWVNLLGQRKITSAHLRSIVFLWRNGCCAIILIITAGLLINWQLKWHYCKNSLICQCNNRLLSYNWYGESAWLGPTKLIHSKFN